MRAKPTAILIPVLLSFACGKALSDDGATRTGESPFSTSSTEIVLKVTWIDSMTARRWSRVFFGDGRVEALDVGLDGAAKAPVESLQANPGELQTVLERAATSGLAESSQTQLWEKIRASGRLYSPAEDAARVKVELFMEPRSGGVSETRAFNFRDPRELALTYPEIAELQALQAICEFSRRFGFE